MNRIILLSKLLGTLFLIIITGQKSKSQAIVDPKPIGFTNAEWITSNKSVGPNTWLIFKKEIVLNSNEDLARLSIACDSKYWLYINEKLVVFEGQLKRGPTPNDTYYDPLLLKNIFKKGKNNLTLMVWYWGKDGFSHKNSGKAGLLLEGSIGPQRIQSDSSWLSAIHPAYGNTTWPKPNYRLPEHNILFNAQKDSLDIHSDNTIGFEKALEIGKPNAQPWGNLVPRPIPLWETSSLKNYTRLEQKEVNDTTIIYAFLPKNLMITPYLEIEATVAGQKINIQSDNYKGGGEPNVRTEYITKVGAQNFESLAFTNGHYMVYRIPKGIKVVSLKYRETRFDTQLLGTFKSNNKALNILHQKALNTLHIGIRDHIHDCPDRERALWWGDVVITLGELFYVADTNAHKAVKKAILELAHWQKPDSSLYSPVPAGNWKHELPAQMLASIGEYGFWKYFETTSDTATLKVVYPAVKKYMSLYKMQANGLVQHRKGGWMWHDWGDRLDLAPMDNAWYYLALKGVQKMARTLGDSSTSKQYLRTMNTIKESFQANFWDGNGYRSKEYKYTYDDRVQGMAIIAGFSGYSQWPSLKKILDTTFNAGAYLEKYILEAAYLMGDPIFAQKRMLDRYQKMIDSPHTTLWEGWDIGSPTYGGGSYNHGWTGGPLTLMHQYITGVQTTKNSVHIEPHWTPALSFSSKCYVLGGKTMLNQKVTSSKKNIAWQITPTNPSIKYTVKIPTAKAKIIGNYSLKESLHNSLFIEAKGSLKIKITQ
jgi:alpha-L-rhamnosidase